ncbi:MAG: hypothetical protein ACJA1B_001855, partial [Polaribacter sp.]
MKKMKNIHISKRYNMKFTPVKVNLYNFFKLPLAFFGGVRVQSITDNEVVV